MQKRVERKIKTSKESGAEPTDPEIIHTSILRSSRWKTKKYTSDLLFLLAKSIECWFHFLEYMFALT